MRSCQQRFQFAFILIAFLGVIGCGSNTSTVKGTVTYKGQPVDYGSVVFVVNDKQAVSTDLQADGTYTAREVPYGEAKIEVYSRRALQLPPPLKRKGTTKEVPWSFQRRRGFSSRKFITTRKLRGCA